MKRNEYGRELSRMRRADRLIVRMLHFEVLAVHQSAQDPSRKPNLICGTPKYGPAPKLIANHETAAEMAARKVRGRDDDKGGKK